MDHANDEPRRSPYWRSACDEEEVGTADVLRDDFMLGMNSVGVAF